MVTFNNSTQFNRGFIALPKYQEHMVPVITVSMLSAGEAPVTNHILVSGAVGVG